MSKRKKKKRNLCPRRKRMPRRARLQAAHSTPAIPTSATSSATTSCARPRPLAGSSSTPRTCSAPSTITVRTSSPGSTSFAARIRAPGRSDRHHRVLVARHVADANRSGRREFHHQACRVTIKLVPLYTSYLRELAIDPPFVIGLTLVGVRGMRHAELSELARARRDFPTFDRDVVTLRELFVDAEQLAQAPPTYLAPMIHALWQAGGRPACPRYAADGTYKP